MDRRDKLLSGIDVASGTGMEIGALCRPFLSRDDGEVIYVDHADTETLRKKYGDDPDVQLDKLVHVDAVWGANALADAVDTKVDYVVASHVVEHVPDLIGWLGELRAVLKDGGEIRLIVPDKRFTFDYLRYETRVADVVYAHMVRARVPQPNVVLDYVVNVVKLDGGQSWRGEVDGAALEHHHTLQDAERCANSVLHQGAYHDVHCWVFTPKSFGLLLAELASNGLIAFECTRFFDTAPYTNEFFVGLRPTHDSARAEQSWREMAASAQHIETEAPSPRAIEFNEKLTQAESAIKDVSIALVDVQQRLAETQRALSDARQARDLAELNRAESQHALALSEQARDLAEHERAESRRTLDAILESRTWKVTAKLISANRSIRKLAGLVKP